MIRRLGTYQSKWSLIVALAALASVLLISSLSYAHDLVWPGAKLKALFPKAESFEQKNLYVSDDQRAALEKAIGTRLPEEDLKPSIYLAVVKGRPEGPAKKVAAIIFSDAYGEGGRIEIGVVVGGKGEIIRIRLFENKESQKINQPDFLNSSRVRRLQTPLKSGPI